MIAPRHRHQFNPVARLILGALALLVSCMAVHAGAYDEYYAKRLPPGCEPKPGVDIEQWGSWMGRSHNQITCREKVPEAVWPHPEVPKPRWPVLKRVPHSFDLTAANDAEGMPIAMAYFRHLCETESGVWFYREVKDPEPLSVINLRPRINEAISPAKKYDRYWLAAPALMDLSMVHELTFDFTGEPPYRGLQMEHDPSILTAEAKAQAYAKFEKELYDKEWDAASKKLTYWLHTDPPRQYRGWSVLEPYPGAISIVERPPIYSGFDPSSPDLNVTIKGTLSDNVKLVRMTYRPPGELSTIELASGREVLAAAPKPTAPQCEGDNWKNEKWRGVHSERECWNKYGSLSLEVTPTNTSIARYGYAWREFFMSEHDLRLGIVGADLMVADMRTGELVAMYRSFSLTVPTKPYIPFRTSTWIENSLYSCQEPTQQMANIGKGFIRAAIGADRMAPDPRRTYEELQTSPMPEQGDELVTRPWALPDELPRQRLEPKR